MKNNYLVMILSTALLQSVFAHGDKENRLNTVDYVDLNRFSGEWLVAALIPSALEKNIQRGIETYSFNDDGTVEIKYTFYKNRNPEKQKLMTQKGWIIDTQSNAHWKISPLWPLKFNYYILELSDDYSYTVIGTDSMNYLWIMVRKESYESVDLEKIINTMVVLGYDRNKIQIMDQ